ncbi:MAG: AAA family ATPase [Pseudomonadales bacterium]
MKDVNDLALLIDAKIPIIVVETYDEQRAIALLMKTAVAKDLGFASWTITDGLNTSGTKNPFLEPGETTSNSPEHVLRSIRTTTTPTLFVLCDFHPYLQGQPEHVRLLKDIALAHETLWHTVVLVSCELEIPIELRRATARMSMSLPDDMRLMKIVQKEASQWSKQNEGKKVQASMGSVKKLARNLRGLSENDATRLARTAIHQDGVIDDNDMGPLNKAKFELIDMEGVLSFEYDTEHFTAVGGLNNLKEWVKLREHVFLNSAKKSTDAPKGLMLLGVQGSGKSLAAKAIAGVWGIPLLRLDMAALYNKYIGETEKNLRKSLEQAELMSPCVLWIDEIEKGIAAGDNDNGTSARILGTLLTWMAERKTRVFVVATSNDVSRMPPELMRKGRLDEVFFVDLPEHEIRNTIFEIHLEKRNFDPMQFDLQRLAEMSEGFSGAEIEQAVVSAVYKASAHRAPLAMEHLEFALANTFPISIVMAEKVAQLRSWASNRTVSAN